MSNFLNNKIFIIILFAIFSLTSCAKEGFFKPGDARKNPPDPKLRVKKNLEEGRGFRLSNAVKGGGETNFEFASSNELWRASLDVLDFMPLTSANYSGGVIITDWYSEQGNPDESIKITVRFLSNEIRSDNLRIIVHKKKCLSATKCKVTQLGNNEISNELLSSIVKTAARFEKEDKKKKKK